MKGYMMFSIGPVQGFISSARKTQDLYNGSFLLSHLSSTALKRVKELGGEAVYPLKETTSMPNVFMVKVDTPSPKEFALEVEKYVREEWTNIYTKAFMKHGLPLNNEILAQLNEFPEIYWVFTEEETEAPGFLSSVKKAKFFEQFKEDGEKCFLCGERRIVFFRKGKEKKAPANVRDCKILDYDEITNLSYKELAPEEGLCALCMAKRLAGEVIEGGDTNFPSTAEVALMYVKKKKEEEFNRYRKIFKGAHFDYQLCYEENLTESYFKKNGYPIQVLDRAKQEQRLLKESLEKEGLKLDKYYSIFMMDGDNMGKILSEGEKQNISSRLMEFTGMVEEEMSPPAGKRIYAGGDDVLGFLNLYSALATIDTLRTNYPDFDVGATASASLTISHYKTPLSMVLSSAREELHKAKSIKGKDALAISLIRHSGEITVSYIKWNSLNKFSKLFNYLISEPISGNFIVSLKSAFRKINSEIDKEMFKPLAKTFVFRSIDERVENKELLGGEVLQILEDLYEEMRVLELENKSSLWNFLNLLEIGLFLKRELREGT